MCEDAARAPAAGAAGLDGHDRLLAGDTPGDAREEARRPEALQVQQDHVGPRILRPVLQQVVARDVGLVADGDEGRDAEVQAPRAVEQRDPERAALGGEGHAAGGRVDRGERRVEPNAGVRIDESHAVGPDHPDPRSANLLQDGRLAPAALLAGLAEPGTDDHEPLDSLREAVVDGRFDARRRDDEDREVDGAGNVCDASVAAPAPDARRRGVDRIHLSAEARRDQVVEDLEADLARVPRRPHDGHRSRLEQLLHRGGGGARGSFSGAFLEGARDLEGDRDANDALVDALFDGEAAVSEDVQHSPVLRMHVGDESRDAAGASDLGEALEQARPDALSLDGVLDGEGHLRGFRDAGDRGRSSPPPRSGHATRPRDRPGRPRRRCRSRRPSRRGCPWGSRGSGSRGSAEIALRAGLRWPAASSGRIGRSRIVAPVRRTTSDSAGSGHGGGGAGIGAVHHDGAPWKVADGSAAGMMRMDHTRGPSKT